MAINDSQKVDILWKKINFGKTETDIEGKEGYNEVIASPVATYSKDVWKESELIPVPPTLGAGLGGTSEYITLQCTVDSSVTGNKTWLTASSVGNPTTLIGDWIDTTFSPEYLVEVYDGNPSGTGDQLNQSTPDEEWNFDYVAGVLYFPNNVPAGLSEIWVKAYRYVGPKGVDVTSVLNGQKMFSGDGDPNLSIDAEVNGADLGDYYIDTDVISEGYRSRYQKMDVAADTWIKDLGLPHAGPTGPNDSFPIHQVSGEWDPNLGFPPTGLTQAGMIKEVSLEGEYDGKTYTNYILYKGDDNPVPQTWYEPWPLGGGSGGGGDPLLPWVVVSANATAFDGARYLANTTSGSFDIALPSGPSVNDRVTIVPLYPTYDVNPLTVLGSGENIMGSGTDLLVNQLGASIELFYVNPTVGWAVINQGDVGIINNIDDSGVSIYIELTDTGIGHTHSATVTFEQISDLIEGTIGSVVVPSSTNAGHSHNVTVAYQNGIIVVTDISANGVDNHGSIILNGVIDDEPWEVITANYTAEAKERLLADSTLGSFDITLPATPQINDKVSIAPLHPTYDTNPVTVLRNGELINGATDDILLNQLGLSVEFFFVGGTVGWALISKGETTIINNIIIDGGVIVATQPGINTFTNTNTFTADILVPAPTVDGHAATKKYVDDEIAGNVPSDVAFTNAANTYTAGAQDFTSVPMTVAVPSVNASPATKLYVDTEISNNVPTGVAILADANTFTNTNTFSDTTNLNGAVNFTGTNSINATGLFTLDFNRTSGSRLQIGTSTTHDGELNIKTVDGITDAFRVYETGPSDAISIGHANVEILDILADTITIDATTAVDVDSPLNINVVNGGQFNIVDVPGSTLVLQSGGDFEVTAGGGGSLWVQGLRFPNADGTAGQSLSTNGNGSLEFIDALDTSADYTMTGEWAFELSNDRHFIITDDATLVANNYVSGVFDHDVAENATAVVYKTELTNGSTQNKSTIKLTSGDATYDSEAIISAETPDNTKLAQVRAFTDFSDSVIELTAERVVVSADPVDNLGVATKQMVDPAIEYVTATTYTISAADHRKTIEFDNASTITLTINNGLGNDFSFTAIQGGAGKIVWAGSATVNNVDNHVRTRGQHAMATFVSRLNGTFVVGGATEV